MITLPPINPNAITRTATEPNHWLNHPDLVKCAVLILEGQFLVRYLENQQLITKFIAPEALRQAFNQIPIDTGFLAEGVVRWGLNEKGEWLVKFIPPILQEIRLIEGQTPKSFALHLPPLIWLGIGRNYFLFATNRTTFTPQLELFHAPFPNIYPTGQICWGNLQPPLCSNQTIDRAWRLFIKSVFNDHLIQGKSQRFPHNINQFLTTLVHKRCYPIRDLVPISTQPVTITQAIAQLI